MTDTQEVVTAEAQEGNVVLEPQSGPERLSYRQLQRSLENLSEVHRSLHVYVAQLERNLQRAEARVDTLIGIAQPKKD